MKTLCKAILAAALPMLVPAAFGGVTSDVAVPSESFHPPVTREQLMEATRRAKRFVLSHPTTCEAKTCLWYAWNEFDEGGWLCPTRGADGKPDTMRIEALKAALAE